MRSFLLAHLVAFIVDFVVGAHRAEPSKDLEIALLQHQVRLRATGMHERTHHRLFMRGRRLERRHHANVEAAMARLPASMGAREARRAHERGRIDRPAQRRRT